MSNYMDLIDLEAMWISLNHNKSTLESARIARNLVPHLITEIKRLRAAQTYNHGFSPEHEADIRQAYAVPPTRK